MSKEKHTRDQKVLINILTLCGGGYYEGTSCNVEFLQMLLHSIN